MNILFTSFYLPLYFKYRCFDFHELRYLVKRYGRLGIKPERILIIEKNQAQAQKAAKILNAAGYDTVTVADVFDAALRLREQYPDLVTLGRELPAVNGEDAYLRIREACYIPIIVLGDEDEVAEMLESGADACISIPVSPVELVARVRCLLRRKQRTSPFFLESK